MVTRTRNIQSIESVLLLDENNLLMDLFIIDRSSYLWLGDNDHAHLHPLPLPLSLPLSVDQKRFLCIAVRYLFVVVVVDVFGVLNEIPLVS